MTTIRIALLIAAVAVPAIGQIVVKPTKTRVRADIWADNWFAFFLGERPVREDSVPITTERSFNAESFTFEAEFPMTLNFIVKDFAENDTGLEYIGTRRQQLGDGGLIAQFRDDTTNELIAVSSSQWKCLAIRTAPLDEACAREADPRPGNKPCEFRAVAEPENWKRPDFNDSAWPAAVIYSAAEVGPKGGYDAIEWSPPAKFIWTSDLRKDNTILCRATVTRPNGANK